MTDVAGGDTKTREVPRFETVMVVVRGQQRFVALDHLNKTVRFPLNPFSREQADGLRDLMAIAARERKEPLTVVRLVSAINGPPKPEPKTKPSLPKTTPKSNRHARQAQSH